MLLGTAAVVLAALCLVAGRWQWNRYVHRTAQIEAIEARYHDDPAPLVGLLGTSGELAENGEWRPVVAHGTYEPDSTVLLRNRPVDGQAGYHVLVPLRLDAGQSDVGDVLIVDRGFLPWTEGEPTMDQIPAPPAGDVAAVVTMRPAEPASPRAAPAGQVHAIDPAQVLDARASGGDKAQGARKSAPEPIAAYGQLRSEDSAATEPLHPLPPPDLDPGSHLSYTVQWWIFAAGALGGFFLLLRRDSLERTGRAPTAGDLVAGARSAGAGARAARSRPRRPTAEEEEDALIDAQLTPHARETNSR